MTPGMREGADPGYATNLRRRASRRRALILLAIVALVGIGMKCYSLGLSSGIDVDAAYYEGTSAGEKRGSAIGAQEGFDSAFRAARRHAFNAAYRDAYAAAYRDEFDAADLPDPRQVKVSAP